MDSHNKFFNVGHLFLAVLMLISGCRSNSNSKKHSNYSIRDDLNTEVRFDSIPHRMITLAPNLTEIIYTLNLQDRLIGNTTFCNYPEDAKYKAKVGDLISIDYEKILSLKPDLIILTMEGNIKEQYDKLKQLGFKIFVSNPRDYNGIKKTVSDMANIFKIQNKAKQIIADWDMRFNNVKGEIKNKKHLSAIFFVGFNPIMAAGKNTFINELMTSAGLTNITSDSPFNYSVFSREQIIKRNPDYILATSDMLKHPSELVNMYPEWKYLKAVKEQKIISVNADMYLRPGPRFIPALEDLVSKLYKSGKSEF